MKTVIIYESSFGNTRRVAEELARVAAGHGPVEVHPAEAVGSGVLDDADLVLVGGPTHAHGMSWQSTREEAAKQAAASGAAGPPSDDRAPGIDAAGTGLREWFHRVDHVDGTAAAAFDTRVDGPEFLTGRASLGISRRLRHHGFDEVAAPRSFLVDRENDLLDGEITRAGEWAVSVYESLLSDAVR